MAGYNSLKRKKEIGRRNGEDLCKPFFPAQKSVVDHPDLLVLHCKPKEHDAQERPRSFAKSTLF